MPYVGTRYIQDGSKVGTPQGNPPSPTPQKSTAVTPSDTTPVLFDSLYIGVTGDVTVQDTAGNTALYKAQPVGELVGAVTRVMATGTTATNILGQNL